MWDLRRATPEDAPAVANVHVRSWQVGYQGLMPAAALAELRAEDRAARYTFHRTGPDDPATFVAVDTDESIRGFVTLGPCPDDEPSNVGQLWALYVDPDFWGRGVGKVLITLARSRLVDLGFDEAVLWVLRGNERAERFYRQDGWVSEDVIRSDVVWGVRVEEKRYRTSL